MLSPAIRTDGKLELFVLLGVEVLILIRNEVEVFDSQVVAWGSFIVAWELVAGG